MELIAAVAFFGLCMAGLSVGVLLKGKPLDGSCGTSDDGHCGACGRQEREICPGDDPLVAAAQRGHPDPEHHR